MSYISTVLSAAPLLKREWNKKTRLSLQNSVRIALPTHRAAACLRHRLGASAVTVSASKSGVTQLGGLMICKAGHICPVCHHNKMEADKKTVSTIVLDHYNAGKFMVDAVFTVPHTADESLEVVQKRLDKVWNAMRSKDIWRKLSTELGIVGCIRRLEVTLTRNGWHAHYHVSFLCSWELAKGIKGHNRHNALNDAFTVVASSWASSGIKAGIKICLWAQSAVAIVAAVDAEKAIKYNMKNMGYGEKDNSLTPMDLLRIIEQVTDTVAIYSAKRLFSEYADAILGKHAVTYYGIAKIVKNSLKKKSAAEKKETTTEYERLGLVSAKGWNAVTLSDLREEISNVTTREALTSVVWRAAAAFGFLLTPIDWLILTPETKTVIEVKSLPSLCAISG